MSSSHPHPHPSHQPASPSSSSIDSYPSDDSYDEDEESAMIEEEWQESLRQMEIVISIIILPYFGKMIGRNWAIWAYNKYRSIGLSTTF